MGSSKVLWSELRRPERRKNGLCHVWHIRLFGVKEPNWKTSNRTNFIWKHAFGSVSVEIWCFRLVLRIVDFLFNPKWPDEFQEVSKNLAKFLKTHVSQELKEIEINGLRRWIDIESRYLLVFWGAGLEAETDRRHAKSPRSRGLRPLDRFDLAWRGPFQPRWFGWGAASNIVIPRTLFPRFLKKVLVREIS